MKQYYLPLFILSMANVYFDELVNRQLLHIMNDKKLQVSDIKRISTKIDASIFSEDKCSLWTGYVTNLNNATKGMYINFYFRKTKMALHRLLFINYIGELGDDEYIKFMCDNKGRCCNINHMAKVKYNVSNGKNNMKKANNRMSSDSEDCFVLDF